VLALVLLGLLWVTFILSEIYKRRSSHPRDTHAAMAALAKMAAATSQSELVQFPEHPEEFEGDVNLLGERSWLRPKPVATPPHLLARDSTIKLIDSRRTTAPARPELRLVPPLTEDPLPLGQLIFNLGA
jgi:hypothetical protein